MHVIKLSRYRWHSKPGCREEIWRAGANSNCFGLLASIMHAVDCGLALEEVMSDPGKPADSLVGSISCDILNYTSGVVFDQPIQSRSSESYSRGRRISGHIIYSARSTC